MKPVYVKNAVIGEGMPSIVVPVALGAEQDVRRRIHLAKEAGAELVELRGDALPLGEETVPELLALLRAAAEEAGELPLLFTLRTKAEGGSFGGDDALYSLICAAVIRSGLADLVDLEYRREGAAALGALARRCGVKSVFSSHHFEGTPGQEEIMGSLLEMAGMGADVAKAACMPASFGDCVTVLAAGAEAKRTLPIPAILISMGKEGTLSRISGEAFGSAATFACLPGQESAPGQLEIHELREHLLAMHARLQKGPLLFLTGFMGTGKSTVGAGLAGRTGLPLIEMDAELEREAGMTIPEIFARYGEEAFRDRETAALARLCLREPAIISCGGGSPLRSRNRDLMKALGRVVLLTAGVETLTARLAGESDGRPVLKNRMSPEGLAELLAKRERAYAAAADYVVSTDGRSVEEICDAILQLGTCTQK